MDRIAKFFIPLRSTLTLVDVPAQTGQIFPLVSNSYQLPPSFFPMPANQSARFTMLNIVVAPGPNTQPAGLPVLDASYISSQIIASANPNPHGAITDGYIVSFPGFPLSTSSILGMAGRDPDTAQPLPISPSLVLPVVNVGWEWDTFATTGLQPSFLTVRLSVLMGVEAGQINLGFEGAIELWRV